MEGHGGCHGLFWTRRCSAPAQGWRPRDAEASGANSEAETAALWAGPCQSWEGDSGSKDSVLTHCLGNWVFPQNSTDGPQGNWSHQPGPKSTETSGKTVPDSIIVHDPMGLLSSWGQNQVLRDGKGPLDWAG